MFYIWGLLPSTTDNSRERLHHHPDLFHPELVINPLVWSVIRKTFTAAVSNPRNTKAYEKILDKIEEHYNSIDWLTKVAQRLLYSDMEALYLFHTWLDSHKIDG